MVLFGVCKVCVEVLCGILAQYTCTVCLEPTCTLPVEGRVEAHRSCRIRFAIKSQRSPAPESLRFRVADTNEANREKQSHGKRAHRRNGHTVFFLFRPVDIFRSQASPSL